MGGGIRRGLGIGVALCAGEREDLRADDGGRAMHFAEVRERELYAEKDGSSLEAWSVASFGISRQTKQRELTIKSMVWI